MKTWRLPAGRRISSSHKRIISEHMNDFVPEKQAPYQAAYHRKKQRKFRKMVLQKGNMRAAHMRNNPTEAEKLVYQTLGKLGVRFDFQKVVEFQSRPAYRIVDFFIPSNYYVIEVDGENHNTTQGIADDLLRNAQFKDEYPHIKFLRLPNREAFSLGLEDRLAQIFSDVCQRD